MSIEVTVQSTLPAGQPQGFIPIIVDSDTEISSIIQRFFIDYGCSISDVENYLIKTSTGKTLSPTDTVGSCNILPGTILYVGLQDELSYHHRGKCFCNLWWFFAGISLLIGIVGLCVVVYFKAEEESVVYDYGIVFDAGSTHTNMYINQWDGSKFNGTAVAGQYYSFKLNGSGISTYTDNVTGLEDVFKVALDKAVNKIPSHKHTSTKVFLGATAGMRLLNATNSSLSDNILSEIRRTVQKYPFSIPDPNQQIRIISGKEEGTFSWITSNYLLGNYRVVPKLNYHIPSENFPTVGALDMGGASTQITFQPAHPDKIPSDYKSTRLLYGYNYTIFSYSFLCYGIREAERKFRAVLVEESGFDNTTVMNPCEPSGLELNESYTDVFEAPCTKGPDALDSFGFNTVPPHHINKNITYKFVGESNPELCKQKVSDLFSFKNCSYKHCSFNGQYQPYVHGNFLAFSSFFYTTDFLNLTAEGHFSLDEFTMAMTDLCKKTWAEVKEIPVSPKFRDALPWYCFEANFIHTILVEGYGFNQTNWNTLTFQETINGTEIGWALGYMLDASDYLPTHNPQESITLVVFIVLVILFAIFILISVGFVCFALRKFRGPRVGEYQRHINYVNYGAI